MIVVTNLNDAGAGSLRAAIAAAALGEEITFSVTGTITLTTGELFIAQGVIITGPGRSDLVVSGGFNSRVFNVDNGIVSITGLSIINGSEADGGGLLNNATLTMEDVLVTGNICTNNGGGIWNTSTITMTDCDIVGNQANVDGGGLWSDGTVTASNCNFESNQANGGGGVWSSGTFTMTLGGITQNTGVSSAGGVFSSGTATLTEVTVSGNSGSAVGDGIYNSTGTLTFIRSTLSDHVVAVGVAMLNELGTFESVNSTFSGNVFAIGNVSSGSVELEHCTVALNDTGVFNEPGAILSLYNTILAGNATQDLDADTADVISLGANIFGTTTNPVTPGAGDQFGVTMIQLNISALQNNGGPTFTIALLDGSVAIDAGNNALAPATDQRGFPRIDNGTIDIGAYESTADVPVPPEPPVPPLPPPEPPPPAPVIRRTCPIPAPRCPAPEEPVENLSSEAPDPVTYPVTSFGYGDWDPGIGDPWVISNGCGVTCYAPTVEEALNCANALQLSCEADRNPIPDPGQVYPPGGAGEPMPPIPPNVTSSPQRRFRNVEKSATSFCEDGSPYTYIVPAGTLTNFSQQQADQMAQQMANERAVERRWCIGTVPRYHCQLSPIDTSFAVTGFNDQVPIQPYPIVLVSGSLPAGITFTQSPAGTFVAQGTPTALGISTFTVRIIHPTGETRDKTQVMEIWAITTTSVPDGVVGSTYNKQIATSGDSSNDTFAIVEGELPDGLSMSTAGLITGTPEEAGSFGFTVRATRGSSTCEAGFEMEVPDVTCPEFKQSVATSVTRYCCSASDSGRTLAVTTLGTDVLNYDGASDSVFASDVNNLTGPLAYMDGSFFGIESGTNDLCKVSASTGGIVAQTPIAGLMFICANTTNSEIVAYEGSGANRNLYRVDPLTVTPFLEDTFAITGGGGDDGIVSGAGFIAILGALNGTSIRTYSASSYALQSSSDIYDFGIGQEQRQNCGAFASSDGMLYVSIHVQNPAFPFNTISQRIFVLNPATLAQVDVLDMSAVSMSNPTGMVYDEAQDLIHVLTDNTYYIIQVSDRTVLCSFPTVTTGDQLGVSEFSRRSYIPRQAANPVAVYGQP